MRALRNMAQCSKNRRNSAIKADGERRRPPTPPRLSLAKFRESLDYATNAGEAVEATDPKFREQERRAFDAAVAKAQAAHEARKRARAQA